MRLEGSCQCGAVRFTVDSDNPYPYQHCYCSICRKTQGGSGAAVNLSAKSDTLNIEGEDRITRYHARIRNPGEDEEVSTAERCFCKECGTALWLYDPTWPELLHPFASAIDMELPTPPERTHIMLAFKPAWVPVPAGPDDRTEDHYPSESIADWHKRLNLSG
ncbi:GFA family protein [Marinivivus vitaminiproducens]|uniref:GFA family protein n=1 Tax=Marinivivus vitaminiproducens TaxID=3035935 RepID=UPI00279C09FB|nr:GFA family protein [Geminicoccaceae bacterium SCSIO 64248]